jgi:hypothetical protein
MEKRGRPRTSALTRQEQLRQAKRDQRLRERRRGVAPVHLQLPRERAEKLRAATNTAGFEAALGRFLDDLVVDLDAWPVLRELAWNRADRFIPGDHALGLYERNWRLVDPERMKPEERALLDRLRERFGRGLPNG